MVVVLVVAAGAGWEVPVLEHLAARPGIVVLKRCVDVDELLAASSAGQAQAAVVALDAPGLDEAAVDLLHRHQVRVVAVSSSTEAARARALRVGVDVLADESDPAHVPDLLEAADEPHEVSAPPVDGLEPPSASGDTGRVVAVWGPAGAPGRTTVATAIAATLAGRGVRTTLVDADPYGGSVAQQLGVLDEVSGLLSAARLTGDGALEAKLGSVQRAVGDHLTVVTGLPRADRWAEVRPGVVEHLLDVARAQGHVVVDTGFSLEDDPGGALTSRPGRNHLTLAALEVADDVVVVGSADPVGLARLARGLAELHDRRAGAPVRVVVNRMRAGLGWSERDITSMAEGFTRLEGIHFLPDDRAGVDRALVTGSSVVDAGDSELVRALGGVADALVPSSMPPRRRKGRPGLLRRSRAAVGRRP